MFARRCSTHLRAAPNHPNPCSKSRHPPWRGFCTPGKPKGHGFNATTPSGFTPKLSDERILSSVSRLLSRFSTNLHIVICVYIYIHTYVCMYVHTERDHMMAPINHTQKRQSHLPSVSLHQRHMGQAAPTAEAAPVWAILGERTFRAGWWTLQVGMVDPVTSWKAK